MHLIRRAQPLLRFGAIMSGVLASQLVTSGALAQASSEELALLREQLEALRAEQAQASRRIADLEAALARASTPSAAGMSVAATASRTANAAASPATAPAPAATFKSSSDSSRLQLSGDLRVRYESNFGDRDARNRDRGVLRARLRAAYAVNSWLTVGGQLATGDPDDPNSSDITLSNFDDDLQVSLDQAYLRGTFGNLQIHAGKIPQPFVRTDLVWDGDVNPQGVSASYKVPLGSKASLKATGLYFLVDEAVAGPDSRMIGGQIALEAALAPPLKLELAAAYYDYSLRSTAGEDSGDFRSNLFANGHYLSDFNLFDVIGALTWTGANEKWPVRLIGDYVKNYGSIVSDNEGFGIDLLIGRTVKRGDWRFGYGYAQTGVDAVLSAFSHDNTNIATNYLQHSFSIDYVPVPNVVLNATYYRYRPKSALFAGSNDPGDWLDRLRLNFLVNF